MSLSVCWKCGFLEGHPDQLRPHPAFNCHRKLQKDDPNIGNIVEGFFLALGRARCHRIIDDFNKGLLIDLEMIEALAGLGLRELDGVSPDVLLKVVKLKVHIERGTPMFRVTGAA